MEQTCTSVHAGAGSVRLRMAEKSTPGSRVVCGTQGVRRTPRSFRARAAPKTPSRPTRRSSSIQAGTRCTTGSAARLRLLIVFQFLQRIKGWYLDELDEELL